MPLLFEEKHLKIRKVDDRRRKLSDDDRRQIVKLKGQYSLSQLGKMFGVSKKLVFLIHHPEKQQTPDWQKYYNKEKHREYSRVHRSYKSGLYRRGRLV
jgi:transposase-like protein